MGVIAETAAVGDLWCWESPKPNSSCMANGDLWGIVCDGLLRILGAVTWIVSVLKKVYRIVENYWFLDIAILPNR